MITFLLLLLLMPKDVIEYKTIDYVKPVVQTDPWLSSPMLDSRVQTNNRYLDSVIGSDVWRTIASDPTPIKIDSFTNEITGNYKRYTTNKEYIIPTDWTYFINAWAIFSPATVNNWLRILVIELNWSPLQLDYISLPTANLSSRLSISELFNLQEWDLINVYVAQSSTELLTVTTKLKIFRTSQTS